jgi:hypothetical protein
MRDLAFVLRCMGGMIKERISGTEEYPEYERLSQEL